MFHSPTGAVPVSLETNPFICIFPELSSTPGSSVLVTASCMYSERLNWFQNSSIHFPKIYFSYQTDHFSLNIPCVVFCWFIVYKRNCWLSTWCTSSSIEPSCGSLPIFVLFLLLKYSCLDRCNKIKRGLMDLIQKLRSYNYI